MTNLQKVYDECSQSVWIDNLKRSYITSGELQSLIDQGVRGLTSNPTIFQKAIDGSADYDEQIRSIGSQSVEETFWTLAQTDVNNALDLMRPLYDNSGGNDGFVSLEVSPRIANDTAQTTEDARTFHVDINKPNLMVKIPATKEGLPAIETMIREGRNINVTLIFSLDRYEAVIEAYLKGLEACEGDLSSVNSVASFFISRVDTEIDKRLDEIGTEDALALRGKGAVAQAHLAYQLFTEKFSGPRWEALVARGAKVQRPLWASTSTKNPSYPDLLYVDTLIGPSTVNTMPDTTVQAFADHGTIKRTVDADFGTANDVWKALEKVGVDTDDVGQLLEDQGVASFAKSFEDLLGSLEAKMNELGVNA